MLPKRRHNNPPKWAWLWSCDYVKTLPSALMQSLAWVRQQTAKLLIHDLFNIRSARFEAINFCTYLFQIADLNL